MNAVNQKLPQFNGFFFALNLPLIANCTFSSPHRLFDDRNLVTGQEADLLRRIIQRRQHMHLSPFAFLYHFKSVTIQAAIDDINMRLRLGLKTPATDFRQDLAYYHPEQKTSLNSSAGSDKTVVVQLQSYPSLYGQYQKLDFDTARDAQHDGGFSVHPADGDCLTAALTEQFLRIHTPTSSTTRTTAAAGNTGYCTSSMPVDALESAELHYLKASKRILFVTSARGEPRHTL